MTDRNANPLHAVSTLLEERQRYEAWLSQLESRRSSTPPHVYARVHADYDKRLAEVMERLGSRTGELHEMSRELRARIDRVQEEENRRRDERAEAELRATVGEFTTQEWNELRERTDSEIVRLGTEAAALRDELARLDALLRTAATPHRSADNAAVPESGAGSPAASPPVPAAAPPPASPAATPEPRPGSRAFDELAFLQSVVDPKEASRRASAAASDPPAARPPAAPAPDTRTPTPAAPAASQPSSGGDGAAGGRATEPGRRMPTPSEAPPPVAPPLEPAINVQRDSVPSFLKDVPNEQVKTLRCQECGTMNYPTEWYCERCGGELAAM